MPPTDSKGSRRKNDLCDHSVIVMLSYPSTGMVKLNLPTTREGKKRLADSAEQYWPDRLEMMDRRVSDWGHSSYQHPDQLVGGGCGRSWPYPTRKRRHGNPKNNKSTN